MHGVKFGGAVVADAEDVSGCQHTEGFEFTIVPEPVTLLLLALAAELMRRHRTGPHAYRAEASPLGFGAGSGGWPR